MFNNHVLSSKAYRTVTLDTMSVIKAINVIELEDVKNCVADAA